MPTLHHVQATATHLTLHLTTTPDTPDHHYLTTAQNLLTQKPIWQQLPKPAQKQAANGLIFHSTTHHAPTQTTLIKFTYNTP